MFYIKNITSGGNGKNYLVLYEQLNLSEQWL